MKRNLMIGDTVYRLEKGDWKFLPAGTCNHQDKVITISSWGSLPRNETLFHELFHACEAEIGHKSDEEYVERMSSLLFDTLTRSGFLSMEIGWDQLDMMEEIPLRETAAKEQGE